MLTSTGVHSLHQDSVRPRPSFTAHSSPSRWPQPLYFYNVGRTATRVIDICFIQLSATSLNDPKTCWEQSDHVANVSNQSSVTRRGLPQLHTSSDRSGKPPRDFRSQSSATSAPAFVGLATQTRNVPAVSGATSGISIELDRCPPPDILELVPSAASLAEKVRNSSVWTHVARCCQRQRSQNWTSASR